MKKYKKYIWPVILSIFFTTMIKLGLAMPRERFSGRPVLADDTFSFITWLVVAYLGFYIMLNGPIYLRKKKEDRIEGFRRKDKEKD